MLRSAGTIGVVLCLGFARSQGKPPEKFQQFGLPWTGPEDASDAPLAKRLSYGDDSEILEVASESGDVRVVVKGRNVQFVTKGDDGDTQTIKVRSRSGKVRVVAKDGTIQVVTEDEQQVEFYFRHEGKNYVLVRTEEKLSWEDAKAKCASPLEGELPTLTESYVLYGEERAKQIWDGSQSQSFANTMKAIKKITGGFKNFWVGQGPGVGGSDKCEYVFESTFEGKLTINLSSTCAGMQPYLFSFLCQLYSP